MNMIILYTSTGSAICDLSPDQCFTSVSGKSQDPSFGMSNHKMSIFENYVATIQTSYFSNFVHLEHTLNFQDCFGKLSTINVM